MKDLVKRRLAGGLIVLAIFALPLSGAALAHRASESLFRFPPPLDIPSDYPRFSWLAVCLVVAPIAVLVSWWIRACREMIPAPTDAIAIRSLPWWGALAWGWTCVWWIMAWTRTPWFAAGQRFTFFPLWIGFVVGVNAFSWQRTGSCQMLRAPARWLELFGASAVFWWVFEWLNRFARNWHYLSVEEFGPFGYAANATICFSTVLPAVAAVGEWLRAHPRWEARFAAGPPLPVLNRPGLGWILVATGLVALALTGFRPRWFYPSLWLAPLLLAEGSGIANQRPGIWSGIAIGDWRRAASWAVAALICGCFWELWNYQSLAKWIYTVPYADRWHVFEMPFLGYFGYLPFGLECLVACDAIGRNAPASWLTPAWPRRD
jgi:hypothetical protein